MADFEHLYGIFDGGRNPVHVEVGNGHDVAGVAGDEEIARFGT